MLKNDNLILSSLGQESELEALPFGASCLGGSKDLQVVGRLKGFEKGISGFKEWENVSRRFRMAETTRRCPKRQAQWSGVKPN